MRQMLIQMDNLPKKDDVLVYKEDAYHNVNKDFFLKDLINEMNVLRQEIENLKIALVADELMITELKREVNVLKGEDDNEESIED